MKPRTHRAVQWLRFGIYVAVISVALSLAIQFGVERKPWWLLWWDVISGGSLGAIAGALFFVCFGAIGFVSGPLFGAVGMIGLVAGGALGGIGLGSLVHIATHPSEYAFRWPIIFAVLALGIAIAAAVSSFVGRKLNSTSEDPT